MGTATQPGLDLVPLESVAASIYVIRGQQVMLDAALAALYGVETKVLNQAVRRNRERFPPDFMFQLTAEEAEKLRSQIVTSSSSPEGAVAGGQHGGRRYLPYAFTEQGVAMLSSVLKSPRAVQVNISIMRTFVRIRQVLAGNEELGRRVAQHDRQIAVLFDHVRQLLAPAPAKKSRIGFA